MRKKLITMLAALALSAALVGCTNQGGNTQTSAVQLAAASSTVLSNINISSGNSESVGEPNTYIELGNNITVNGDGATVENNKVKITSAGTYSIKGSLSDGQIIVDAGENDKVYIILNGVNITSSNNSPIYVKSAKKAIISLADNTENSIKDGEKYELEDATTDEPNAAIFSKSDLIFIGNGSLKVDAKYKNGITSKDDLKIQSGNIIINAVEDGVKGKDSVVITNGKITINSGEDGIVSSNDEDAEKGYVLLEGGTVNITSGQDGIQAETNAFVKDGELTINAGGGSKNAPVKEEKGPGMGKQFGSNTSKATETNTSEETISTKAIKAGENIITEGGTFNIDSASDAFHSNNNIVINAGTFNISTGDDGLHADTTLVVNGGNINIAKAYEGIESENITINNGEINLTASDDGINASSSSKAANENVSTPSKGSQSTGTGKLNINGGKITVNAEGDGLDANGSINMKDGTVIVNGPTTDGNGSLDYDTTFTLSGGTLITAGSAGMAQAPSTDSTQNSIKVTLASQSANTIVHIESENGEEIATFVPTKQYSSVVVSSPKLKTGSTYKVYVGGSSTGTAVNSLYSDGTYTKGQEIGSAKISGAVTEITQEGVTVSKGMGGGGRGGMKAGAASNK